MKNKIFFSLALLSFQLNAQINFYKPFVDENCFSEVWDAAEMPNGDYLIALNNVRCPDVDSFTGSELIRINKFGTILNTKKFNAHFTEIEHIGSIHILPDGDIFVVTKIFIPFKAERWLGFYCYDSNLKLKKSYRSMIEDTIQYMSILKSSYEPDKQRVVFYFTDGEYNSYAGWIGINLEGFKIAKIKDVDFLLDLCPRLDSAGYVFNHNGVRYILDSTLQITNKTPASTYDHFNSYIKPYKNKYLTMSNESLGFPPNNTGHSSYDISCKLIDTQWNVVRSRSLGKKAGVRDTFDTISFRGVSWQDPNKIYVGWTTMQDFDIDIPFEEQNSWLSLAQLDSNLNVTWSRYYFGEKFRALNGLITTSDKGVLLFGRQTLGNTEDSDGFIMKVNENGILSSEDNNSLPDIPITIGPNPCQNYFDIAIGQNVENINYFELILYNNYGLIVDNQTISTGVNRISMEHFPAAVYFYVLKIEDKVVKRGKVIKI